MSLGERGEGLLEISVRILDGLAREMTRYRDGQDYGELNTRILLVIAFALQVVDTDSISQRSHTRASISSIGVEPNTTCIRKRATSGPGMSISWEFQCTSHVLQGLARFYSPNY